MGMRKNLITTVTVLGMFLLSTQSWARSSFGSSSEMNHELSVGAGIASPSYITGLFGENAAGLAYNQTFKIQTHVNAADDQFNPLGYGAGFLAGNGIVGGGLYAQAGGETGVLSWGLGAAFDSIDLAIGVNGSYALIKNGGSYAGTTNSWGLNAGLIVNPNGKFRVGVNTYGLLNSVDAVGVGLALDPNQWATLVVDSAYTMGGNGTIELKPGFEIHLAMVRLAAAYGFKAAGPGGSVISDGASGGLGFSLGSHVGLQFYYSQLSKYYGGLTIRF